MTRLLLIFALLFSTGRMGLQLDVANADTASAERCCCCPTDTCHCGCDTPKKSPDTGDEDNTRPAQLCDCDDHPWGMPTSTSALPQRVKILAVDWAPLHQHVTTIILQGFFEHAPHGPPPATELLATIKLLN